MDLIHRPYGFLAELTYRCPLHCPYCSNPPGWKSDTELTSEEWIRTIKEAAELGVLQIGFSGGEPLLRKDLEPLIHSARQAGLYTNLITSGLGLNEDRAIRLSEAGLDNIQISFQATAPTLADTIAGAANSHTSKLRAVEIVKRAGIGLSLNVVLHRFNIDQVSGIIEFAENLGATRLELANTQYYGWAYRNRATLMPARAQVDAAAKEVSAAMERLAGKMKILYVLPDYFGSRPKPCMNGWGQKYITVNPSGFALPCPTAWEIPNLRFDTVREKSIRWIWKESESFNHFRGVEWMPEPCRSCPQKEIDFGGCRCQAALLTGDASNTDPACELSTHHHLVQQAVAGNPSDASFDDLVFRQNSSRLGSI
jgi:pyrroloquinoline quinone biosynthesis protein E